MLVDVVEVRQTVEHRRQDDAASILEPPDRWVPSVVGLEILKACQMTREQRFAEFAVVRVAA